MTVLRSTTTDTLASEIQPIVKTLVARLPELASAADAHGTTPLHIATLLGSLSLATCLPHGEAELERRTIDGRSPIDLAMLNGHAELIELFMPSLSPPKRAAEAKRLSAYASLPGAALAAASIHKFAKTVRKTPLLDPAPAEERASCAEGGGWAVAPALTDDERRQCQIDQRSRLTEEEYYHEYYRTGRPVLIRGAMSLAQRCAFQRSAPGMQRPRSKRHSCGGTAYPNLTGQKICGVFSMEDLNGAEPHCEDAGRTRPVCVTKPRNGVNESDEFRNAPACFRYEEEFPPMSFMSRAWRVAAARQFFMGGDRSGAAFHFHGAAYNVLFFGIKEWILTPPRYSGVSGGASISWPENARAFLPPGLPLRCTQGPGDMILLPRHWGHATVNRRFSMGIGDLYCDRELANLLHSADCRAPYDNSYPAQFLRRRWGKLIRNETRAPFRSARAAAGGAMRSVAQRTLPPRGQPLRRAAPSHRRAVRAEGRAPQPSACRKPGANTRPVAFVHINKAGGTGMRSVLAAHAMEQLLERVHPQSAMALRKMGSRYFHASASLQLLAVGQQAWVSAYSFALVRNPWARQVSLFHFLLQEAGCRLPKGSRAPDCDTRVLPIAGDWLSDPAKVRDEFRKWIRDIRAVFPPGHPKQYLFGSRSHGNDRDAWFNASQISWLVDARGKVLVEDIFKLEELEDKWPTLQRKICGLSTVSYAQAMALARRNPSSHKSHEFYYDEPTSRIVEEYMEADIRYFGYTLESTK